MNQTERFLNAHELCQLLHVSKSTLWRLRQDGLPYLTIRRQLRFDLAEVRQWLSERDKPEQEGPSKEADAPEPIIRPGVYRCRSCGRVAEIQVPMPATRIMCVPCGAMSAVEPL